MSRSTGSDNAVLGGTGGEITLGGVVGSDALFKPETCACADALIIMIRLARRKSRTPI